MSTVMDSPVNESAVAQRPAAGDVEEEALHIPWRGYLLLALVVAAFVAFLKWYQHSFAWSVGLDSWSPEFQAFWMTWWYTEVIVIPVLGAVGIAYLWFSRDRAIENLAPRTELMRYYSVFGLLTALSVVLVAALGILGEGDAAWHQVVIRDTDFTPTHIFLFYLGVPAAMIGMIMAWLWVHTRLPYFSFRVSVPFSLAVLGFFMVGPVVAFNEWGHTFFYAEELFGSPVHWFFALAAFFVLCLAGFAVQCLQRVRELTELVDLETFDEARRNAR